MQTSSLVSLLLIEFFRLLDERGIPYCVMGDTRSLPIEITSDVDIIVPQAFVAALPQLIDAFCTRHRVRLVQCLQHEHNAYYFVVALHSVSGGFQFLALDLCGDYFRRGRKLLSADELLATARPALDDDKPKGFMVCAPAFEFCYYVIKKIDKQNVDAKHIEHLTQQWQRDPHGARKLIERFWGVSVEARLLIRAADSGDWTTIAKLLPRMRAALRRHIASPAIVVAELARRWRRWRHPTGLFVAALGPDGSGKSSLIATVDRQIREAFRATSIVHLRPGFLYRPKRIPNEFPHAVAPRGWFRSAIKLLFFAADYILGYLFFVRPRLVHSSAVLFDRYYDDLLVDPRRYRHRGSLRIARFLRTLVARPTLWLLLDAPTEVLQMRKQEVPPIESERQRFAYYNLLRDQQNVVVLDASQPFRTVVHQATAAILEFCEMRARARLRLQRPERRSPVTSRWLLFCCRHRIPLLSKLTRVIFNSDIYCLLPRDLYLPHPYGIVIHSHTRIGRRVTVMQQATLGGKNRRQNVAPVIGDNVYIGAGARVLGDVTIGYGAIIGANAVVTRDVPANRTVVGANRLLPEEKEMAIRQIDTPSIDEADHAVLLFSITAQEDGLHP